MPACLWPVMPPRWSLAITWKPVASCQTNGSSLSPTRPTDRLVRNDRVRGGDGRRADHAYVDVTRVRVHVAAGAGHDTEDPAAVVLENREGVEREEALEHVGPRSKQGRLPARPGPVGDGRDRHP